MAISGSFPGRTGATLLALVLCVVPGASRAQGPYAGLVGIVRDSLGHPIPNVQVRLNGGSAFRTLTGETGGFTFGTLSPGVTMLSVRRLGFAPDSLRLVLRPGRVGFAGAGDEPGGGGPSGSDGGGRVDRPLTPPARRFLGATLARLRQLPHA